MLGLLDSQQTTKPEADGVGGFNRQGQGPALSLQQRAEVRIFGGGWLAGTVAVVGCGCRLLWSAVVVGGKEVIEIMKKSPQIVETLVLGCIDSYDSEKRRILQHFSRSTRFAILCTAQISKFQQKFVKLFSNFCLN